MTFDVDLRELFDQPGEQPKKLTYTVGSARFWMQYGRDFETLNADTISDAEQIEKLGELVSRNRVCVGGEFDLLDELTVTELQVLAIRLPAKARLSELDRKKSESPSASSPGLSAGNAVAPAASGSVPTAPAK